MEIGAIDFKDLCALVVGGLRLPSRLNSKWMQTWVWPSYRRWQQPRVHYPQCAYYSVTDEWVEWFCEKFGAIEHDGLIILRDQHHYLTDTLVIPANVHLLMDGCLFDSDYNLQGAIVVAGGEGGEIVIQNNIFRLGANTPYPAWDALAAWISRLV